MNTAVAGHPRPRARRRSRRAGRRRAARRSRASAGRSFIMALYGALRSIRMYPIENAVVQKSLDELTGVTERAARRGGRARVARLRRVHLRELHAPPARPRQLRDVQLPARALPRVRRRRAARDGEAVGARLDGVPLVPARPAGRRARGAASTRCSERLDDDRRASRSRFAAGRIGGRPEDQRAVEGGAPSAPTRSRCPPRRKS